MVNRLISLTSKSFKSFKSFKSLTSSVIILILNFLPTSTHAEVSDICTFTQSDIGNLVAEGNNLPTKLVNYGAAGSYPMQMTVSCIQPVKISVSQPIQTAGPEFNPVLAVATLQTSSGNTTNSNNSSFATLPEGRTDLVINLSIDKGNVLQPGNYKYSVKFTIFP
jgi:hypothetical protein